MKKLFYLLIIFAMFLFLGCKNDNLIKVTIHYDTETIIKEVKSGSIIDFEPLDIDSYVFEGWYNEDYTECLNDKIINEDIYIYAKVIYKGISYNINYILNGGEFTSARPNKYITGEELKLPIPSRNDYYAFTGWLYNNEPIDTIPYNFEGDITVTATWEDAAEYYNISYETNGGSIANEINILRQGDAFYLPSISKENFYFRGWYLDKEFNSKYSNNTIINNDITLYAKWEEKTPENTYISFLGDSITTFEGYIPEGFIQYYPQGDVTKVEQTWWYQLTTKLNYNLLVNDSYSGTLVTSGNNYGASEERIKLLATNEHDPDIIIIHMGTNDFTHGISAKAFETAYRSMIDLIIKYYPNAIIYICNHPYNGYGEDFISIRETYNEILAAIAQDYNFTLLDLASIITIDNWRINMYAGAHPNALGMKTMANFIYEEIKKH